MQQGPTADVAGSFRSSSRGGGEGARCPGCNLEAVVVRYYANSGKNNLRFVPDGVEENVNLINPSDNNRGDGGDGQHHIQRVGSRGGSAPVTAVCPGLRDEFSRPRSRRNSTTHKRSPPGAVGRDSSYSSRGRENRRWAPAEVSPRRATRGAVWCGGPP